jgi:hypothetical protein
MAAVAGVLAGADGAGAPSAGGASAEELLARAQEVIDRQSARIDELTRQNTELRGLVARQAGQLAEANETIAVLQRIVSGRSPEKSGPVPDLHRQRPRALPPVLRRDRRGDQRIRLRPGDRLHAHDIPDPAAGTRARTGKRRPQARSWPARQPEPDAPASVSRINQQDHSCLTPGGSVPPAGI